MAELLDTFLLPLFYIASGFGVGLAVANLMLSERKP